jgi:uncharacterized membrane protein
MKNPRTTYGGEQKIASNILSPSLEAAERYISMGLVLVQIPYGSKAPQTKDWQNNGIDTLEQARTIFKGSHNIGLLHQHSETATLDIDDEPLAREAFEAMGLNLDDYLSVATPKIRGAKGIKPVFRMPEGLKLETKKLAFSYKEDGKRKAHTVFELRGAGGQDVLPPSLHPRGINYEWVDGYPESYSDFLELPSELLNLWQKWEHYTPIMQSANPYFKPIEQERKGTNTEMLEVIEKFNESIDIANLLESYGYQRKGKKFVAPGSNTGLAGVAILDSESKQVVYSHHGSDVLGDGKAHDAFDVVRLLECGGDFKQALDKAREHLGLPAFEATSQRVNSLNSSESGEEIRLEQTVNFPELDKAAYHGLAGEIVRAIEPHTEAHPIGLLLSFLAALGIALGNSLHWLVGGTQHPLRLFVVLVGLSGKGRKGTSWGAINGILKVGLGEDFIKQNVTTGLSSGEGLIFAVRDEITKQERDSKTKEYKTVVIDEGTKDKRLMVLESEFGRVLKAMNREGNTLSAVIRQAWDMGSDDVLKVMTKNVNQASSAHIGIIGHVTRDELLRYLEDTETANGFANRFLWAMVKRERVLPFGGSPDAEVISSLGTRLKAVLEWVNKQTDYGQQSAVLGWSGEAVEKWCVLYPKLSEGGSGLSGAVLSRAEAQVMRLAGLYAILDKTTKVEASHLEAAVAVWEYCETSVYGVFGRRTGDTIADTILEELQKSGQLTKSQISALFNRNFQSSRINTAVEILVREGKAKVVKDSSKPGRPLERLELVANG